MLYVKKHPYTSKFLSFKFHGSYYVIWDKFCEKIEIILKGGKMLNNNKLNNNNKKCLCFCVLPGLPDRPDHGRVHQVLPLLKASLSSPAGADGSEPRSPAWTWRLGTAVQHRLPQRITAHVGPHTHTHTHTMRLSHCNPAEQWSSSALHCRINPEAARLKRHNPP